MMAKRNSLRLRVRVGGRLQLIGATPERELQGFNDQVDCARESKGALCVSL